MGVRKLKYSSECNYQLQTKRDRLSYFVPLQKFQAIDKGLSTATSSEVVRLDEEDQHVIQILLFFFNLFLTTFWISLTNVRAFS